MDPKWVESLLRGFPDQQGRSLITIGTPGCTSSEKQWALIYGGFIPATEIVVDKTTRKSVSELLRSVLGYSESARIPGLPFTLLDTHLCCLPLTLEINDGKVTNDFYGFEDAMPLWMKIEGQKVAFKRLIKPHPYPDRKGRCLEMDIEPETSAQFDVVHTAHDARKRLCELKECGDSHFVMIGAVGCPSSAKQWALIKSSWTSATHIEVDSDTRVEVARALRDVLGFESPSTLSPALPLTLIDTDLCCLPLTLKVSSGTVKGATFGFEDEMPQWAVCA